jgi:hypothetical protein
MELHFVCSLQLAKKLPFLIECSFDRAAFGSAKLRARCYAHFRRSS